ncbi:MAG: hypothetical protein AAGH41_10560 [Pseudomonadota bacterium]
MARSDESLAPIAALGYTLTEGVNEDASKGGSLMAIFPLLTISFVVYSLLSVLLGSAWTQEEVAAITLLSDEVWIIRGGDIFLAGSFIFLFIEILNATDTGSESIWNHSLSAGLFIVCMACFMALKPYATSTFFLLMTMALVDMIAGFTITIRSARRDFGVG